jgi:hypothetical protein
LEWVIDKILSRLEHVIDEANDSLGRNVIASSKHEEDPYGRPEKVPLHDDFLGCSDYRRNQAPEVITNRLENVRWRCSTFNGCLILLPIKLGCHVPTLFHLPPWVNGWSSGFTESELKMRLVIASTLSTHHPMIPIQQGITEWQAAGSRDHHLVDRLHLGYFFLRLL